MILSAARAAALAPRREVPSAIPGTRSRTDIFLANWSRGRCAALDVSIISPMHAIAHFEGCRHHALQFAKERKLAAHDEECHVQGDNFIPLVFESLGARARTSLML